MIEVVVRGQDGDEFIFMDHRSWLLNDIDLLASCIAEDDFNNAGSDLNDPSLWPREYEILFNGEWVKVSVDMEYNPTFWAQKL